MIADLDHRLNERIVQIETSLSNVTDDTIAQVEQSLSKVKNETIADLSALANGAEKRANQYGLRLALAGMNFILIYLLVPNIQRWQALELAHKTFTVGGILLASVWIGAWIRRNITDQESRWETVLLIAAGTIVLAAKFVFGS